MKYTIVTIETKQGSKGNPYQLVTLKDQDNIHKTASSFDLGGKAINDVVEGEIVQNGPYSNFKIAKQPRGNLGANKSIKEAQERKQEAIRGSMDRKENAIALSGSQRDAVLIVTNLYPELANAPNKDEAIKSKIKSIRAWLLAEHGDPEDITLTKTPF